MEDWPITPTAGGGASALIHSHLELMAGTVERLVLVILTTPGHSLGFTSYADTQPDHWEKVKSWCDEIIFVEIDPATPPMAGWRRLVLSLWDPALYSYGDILRGPGVKSLVSLIQSKSPDIIWLEHLLPAVILEQLQSHYPIIYSHHDWRWKIKAHREGQTPSLQNKLKFWLSRRHEARLVRSASACVSGSRTELEEMRELGVERTAYFPTTYAPLKLSETTSIPACPRIVHLGGMQTTANRFGLLRFLQICWPSLSRSLSPPPELWVIGNLEGSMPELSDALRQGNIICTGVVPDLSTVLRPYDIHIVPWEYNTGTRTRIPLILNHTQVLVSTRAAAMCLPELRHNENSLLPVTLSEMTDVIVSLYDNVALRTRIADSGRETFLQAYTPQAQQERFNSFIRYVLAGNKA